jgi:hypothetical protein
MPYTIESSGKGFKVCDSTGKCFSKKGLPLKTAERQRVAIALSESKRTGKKVGTFFASK